MILTKNNFCISKRNLMSIVVTHAW